MVFLFALSLQSVSVMIPNKAKSKSINKLDSFYYEEDFTYGSSDARICSILRTAGSRHFHIAAEDWYERSIPHKV